MLELQGHIDIRMYSPDPVMRKTAIKMKAKFDKYWGSFDKINKLVYIGNILDPRYKMFGLSVGLEQVGTSAIVIEGVEWEVRQLLGRMFEFYRVKEFGPNRVDADGGIPNITLVPQAEQGQSRMLRAIKEKLGSGNNSNVSNELDQYLNDACLVTSITPFDIASWWKQNAT